MVKVLRAKPLLRPSQYVNHSTDKYCSYLEDFTIASKITEYNLYKNLKGQVGPDDIVYVHTADPKIVMAFVGKESEITLKAPLSVRKPQGREVDIAPKSVTLRVRGPANILLDKDFPGLVEATLELKADIEPGKYEAAYRVKMPQGCELIEAKPEKVTLTVK